MSVNGSNDTREELDSIVLSKETVDDDSLQNETSNNAYVEGLLKSSNLHVLQEPKARRAYAKGKELGLFHLFFTGNFLEVIAQ